MNRKQRKTIKKQIRDLDRMIAKRKHKMETSDDGVTLGDILANALDSREVRSLRRSIERHNEIGEPLYREDIFNPHAEREALLRASGALI